MYRMLYNGKTVMSPGCPVRSCNRFPGLNIMCQYFQYYSFTVNVAAVSRGGLVWLTLKARPRLKHLDLLLEVNRIIQKDISFYFISINQALDVRYFLNCCFKSEIFVKNINFLKNKDVFYSLNMCKQLKP